MNVKVKNITFLFAALAAAWVVLSFSSCIVDRPGGTGPDNAGAAHLSVRINIGQNTATKDTRAGETEAGNVREQHVDVVYLLLYDSGGDLKYAWKLDASNYADATSLDDFDGNDVVEDSGSAYRFVTVSREVAVQPYDMVVIANPGIFADEGIFGNNPPITDLAGIVADYADISSSVYRTLGSLQAVQVSDEGRGRVIDMDNLGAAYVMAAGTNKMFMSNANGPVYVGASWMKATPGEAEASPVPVSIDRALAKIVVNAAETVTVTDIHGSEMIGTVTDVKWRVRNYNTQAYLLRRFNIIDPTLGGSYGGTMETYASGLAVGRQYLYATDPNMAGGAGLEDNSAAGWDRPWNGYADPMAEDNFYYATENTMNAAAQAGWLGNATYVDVLAKLKITGFPDDAKGFYSFNNGTSSSPEWKIFSWEEVKEWMAGTFPADVSSLSAKLDALRTAGGFTGPFDFDSATEPDGITGEFISKSSSEDIYFHSGGSCMYRIPVEHFNKRGQTVDDYGYYGVVRNNVYKITIKGFKGPGVPSMEIEDTRKYVSFSVTVNEWAWRGTQSENGTTPPIHQQE